MKLVYEYDFNTDTHQHYYPFSADPYISNGYLFYPYLQHNTIHCLKIDPSGIVSDITYVSNHFERISPSRWVMFSYEGNVLLRYNESNTVLNVSGQLERFDLSDETAAQYPCISIIKEYIDEVVGNGIMHYKNSAVYQYMSHDGDVLWQEKHRAYRYTPFEVVDGHVIFGTAGNGGGLYCYRLSDGKCMSAVRTRGTTKYYRSDDKVICRGYDGQLICVNIFENTVTDELALPCILNDDSGLYVYDRYICTVGFTRKNNSPCLCVIKM